MRRWAVDVVGSLMDPPVWTFSKQDPENRWMEQHYISIHDLIWQFNSLLVDLLTIWRPDWANLLSQPPRWAWSRLILSDGTRWERRWRRCSSDLPQRRQKETILGRLCNGSAGIGCYSLQTRAMYPSHHSCLDFLWGTLRCKACRVTVLQHLPVVFILAGPPLQRMDKMIFEPCTCVIKHRVEQREKKTLSELRACLSFQKR